MLPDPFEELGLPKTATEAEVKAKWRNLAKAHHPDYGGDAAEFHRLRQAYERALTMVQRPKLCPSCNGKKRVVTHYGFATTTLTCQTCKGTGEAK